jgi:hypothetical protein
MIITAVVSNGVGSFPPAPHFSLSHSPNLQHKVAITSTVSFGS